MGRATGPPDDVPDLASLNARLGVLASLSGFVFALPALLALHLGGATAVLWLCLAVFVLAMAAGARLPVRRTRRVRGAPATASPGSRPGTTGVDVVAAVPARSPEAAPPSRRLLSGNWDDEESDLAVFRPIATRDVLLALMPMSVLKASAGFLTFLLAFGLRRDNAATWWFGLLLAAVAAGALVGVLLVSHIRRRLSEQQILTAALWLVTAVAVLGAVEDARLVQAVVAFGVGMAGAVAKPSFDALVQQFVPESSQGRAFARFETRLQLLWVVGAFFPVVLTLPIPAGNAVMAVAAAVGASAYMSGRRALHRHP